MLLYVCFHIQYTILIFLVDYVTDDEIIKTEYLSDDSQIHYDNSSENFQLQIIEKFGDKLLLKEIPTIPNKRNKRSFKNNGSEENSALVYSEEVFSPATIRKLHNSNTKKRKRPKDMSREETVHYKRLCNRYRYAKAIPFKLDESAVVCHLCNEAFTTHKFLVSHMATHYPNHICDLCGKSFVLKTHLLGHIRTHDSEKVSCSVCNKLLKKSSMTRHLRTHSGNNEVYACPHCPDRFVSFSTRVNHLAKMHNVDIFKYHCKICSKKFHLANSLSKHVRRCHFQELNATCEECGKGFFDKKSLTEHMLKHTGEKNFQCKICLKSYARKCTLREHVKIHDNVKKSHQCTVCDKIFTHRGSLKTHVWKVHQHSKEEFGI